MRLAIRNVTLPLLVENDFRTESAQSAASHDAGIGGIESQELDEAQLGSADELERGDFEFEAVSYVWVPEAPAYDI